MKVSTLSALSTLFAGLTLAAPVDIARRGSKFSEVDITILQFALTLEHLENTFYQEAFNTFQLQDFIDAGFSEEFFINLQFIAFDESTHVSVLQSALSSAGVVPVQACEYSFPVSDVASFVTLSAVLESIGTSAYLGAAGFVGSRDILTIAASIMATEGLHTALQRSSLGAIGASDPFFTPLDANSVFTLAAQFIVSCPSSNAALPFTAFPSLTVDAQQCFNEVGSFGASQVEQAVSATDTTSANYATMTWADSTDTAVSDIAAVTTTVDTATESATDAAAVTTATDAAATTAPARLRVRQDANATSSVDANATTTTAEAVATESSVSQVSSNSSSGSSCSPISTGSMINLTPDFSSSRHDFSQITEIFITFVEGLNVISIAVQIDQSIIGGGGMSVQIPSGIGGQVFIFITIINISGRTLSDSDVLFGPAILEVAPSLPSLGF
ncbi:hypothetical protein H2202_000188 [Exophiala xenobiotica]|nr:hypothetical protein H2202_000188 [Exophiala xenobiotica]KAK5193832.1 hypothetical protein LTR92_006172 [Exophiala xenobiotica]KAK5208141.1 hypothetical protein LTR41_006077 [Exophiala xenobiotica]KAK5222926.1 hypothetical protein LTR72_005763 [Exophiala xenobiotica]KAK5236909.1 hypothetical protein LTR47_002087 [Exophiala xenobiotica]